jgi:hypothetical protein
MNRFPLFILISILLTGCSGQGGAGGDGGSVGGGDPDPDGQITVGIPDQLSMSLSVTQHSVNCLTSNDGETVDVTIRLADRLNNHTTIPSTRVYFAAEGGAIGDECTTSSGACSVQWRCQDNRPLDGRVTILAWTEGNESFVDENGNGFFDLGDSMVAGTDRGEPFLDKNEDGNHDSNEEFVNYPNPALVAGGGYDGPDGLYAGINCAFPGECAANQSLFIYDENLIVMAAGDLAAVIIPLMDTGTDYVVATPPIDAGTNPTVYFLVVDALGNPLPAGSEITFELEGDAGQFLGETDDAVNDTTQTAINGPPWAYADVSALIHSVRIIEDTENTTDENGFVLVSVAVEEGNTTQIAFDVLDPAM